jgi:hypothetical protein
MKKLFISCPMKGRTEENIRNSMERMHKIAEIIFDEKLEVIPTYIEDNPPENVAQAVWYLGESIKKLSGADYFIGIAYSEVFKGCKIETEVAQAYGIRSTYINLYDMMPDAMEIERNFFNNKPKCTV